MFKDLQSLLAGANLGSLKDSFAKMQGDMQDIEASGEAGGGLVKISLNGKYHCTAVELSPDLFSEDQQVIADLIRTAISHAGDKVQEATQNKMKSMAQLFMSK